MGDDVNWRILLSICSALTQKWTALMLQNFIHICWSFVIITILGFCFLVNESSAQTFAIKPRFEYAGQFSEGVACVREGGRRFYIDKSGKQVTKPLSYDSCYPFSNGLARVTKQGKWGFIDKSANLVIPFRFMNAQDFKEDRAVVSFDPPNLNRLFMGTLNVGVINKAGQFVMNPYLNAVNDFNEGYAVANFGALGDPTVGLIGKGGEIVLRPRFEFLTDFSDGLAAALTHKGSWGLLRTSGDWAIEPKFDSLGRLKDGLAIFGDCGGKVLRPYEFKVPIHCKFGYIDSSGKVLIPAQFTSAEPFFDDRAAVSFSPRNAQSALVADPEMSFGYIDRTGLLVIDAVYKEVKPFSEGVAAVKKSIGDGKRDRWGYIDKSGKPLTKFEFLGADSVSEGLARVWTSEGDGYLSFKH